MAADVFGCDKVYGTARGCTYDSNVWPLTCKGNTLPCSNFDAEYFKCISLGCTWEKENFKEEVEEGFEDDEEKAEEEDKGEEEKDGEEDDDDSSRTAENSLDSSLLSGLLNMMDLFQ